MVCVNGRLLKTLEDTVVLVNDSIRLSCQSDRSEEIQFFHNGKHMYAGGTLHRPYKARFQMETTENHTYALVNGKAGPEDAGNYTCSDEERRGQSSSATLTVLNTRLLCESNMHANGYIGPNTCNLQQEFMTFSCSVSFNGASPRLVWRASNDNSQPINSSVCDHQPNRVNCQLTLASDPSYDGTFFTCQTAQPSGTQYNCSTKVIKVQYFSLDHELKPLDKSVGEAVECSVRSNLNPRFEWLSSEDNQETVVSNTQQHVIRESGLFWCNVSYSVRDVQCSSTAAVIYAHKSVEHSRYRPNVSIAPLSCFVAALIATVLILVFCICKLNRKHKKYELNEEEPWWPERHDQINPLNKHLLKCKTDPFVYIIKPKLMRNFNMKKGGNKKKEIHGIAVLKDWLYVVRDCCEEIEIYSMKDYIYKWSIKVENMASPNDIISHDDKNSLFIDDNKDGKKNPNEIIIVRPTPEDDDGTPSLIRLPVQCRWSIKGENGVKMRIGRLSLTKEGNILIPLMNESKLHEYDCDGNLKREIEIITPDKTFKNIRQAILLRSGYFVLSFGDGADDETQGVFIAKMEGQKLKCIQDDSHSEEQKNIAKFDVTPLNKDNKNEPSKPEVKINIPSYTITVDDLSILVADRKNSRVLLYHVEGTSEAGPRLNLQKELLSKKNGLNNPYRLYLDTTRGHLFVADNEETTKGHDKEKAEHRRILVYSVC